MLHSGWLVKTASFVGSPTQGTFKTRRFCILFADRLAWYGRDVLSADDYETLVPVGELELTPGAKAELRGMNMIVSCGPACITATSDGMPGDPTPLEEWVERVNARIEELDAQMAAGASHVFRADESAEVTHVQLVVDPKGGYQIWIKYRQGSQASAPLVWLHGPRQNVDDFATLDDDMINALPSFNDPSKRPTLPSPPMGLSPANGFAVIFEAARRRHKRQLEAYLRTLVRPDVCGQQPPRQLLLFLGLLKEAKWEMDGPTLLEGWTHMTDSRPLGVGLFSSRRRRWLSLDARGPPETPMGPRISLCNVPGSAPLGAYKIGRGAAQALDATRVAMTGLVVEEPATGLLGPQSTIQLDCGDALSCQALVDFVRGKSFPVMVPAEMPLELKVLLCCQLDWKVERVQTYFQRSWFCLTHTPQQTGGRLHVFDSLGGCLKTAKLEPLVIDADTVHERKPPNGTTLYVRGSATRLVLGFADTPDSRANLDEWIETLHFLITSGQSGREGGALTFSEEANRLRQALEMRASNEESDPQTRTMWRAVKALPAGNPVVTLFNRLSQRFFELEGGVPDGAPGSTPGSRVGSTKEAKDADKQMDRFVGGPRTRTEPN